MRLFARRDIAVCFLSVAATAGAMALAQPHSKILGEAVYDWNSIPVHRTPTGETRLFFRGPTATLGQLEVHATTLNPGAASHPPEKRSHEEVIVIDKGIVDVYANGSWTKVGPGSVVLNAPNQLQATRNTGTEPATYHVISWIAQTASQRPGQ